jgi:hypothetical protein
MTNGLGIMSDQAYSRLERHIVCLQIQNEDEKLGCLRRLPAQNMSGRRKSGFHFGRQKYPERLECFFGDLQKILFRRGMFGITGTWQWIVVARCVEQ